MYRFSSLISHPYFQNAITFDWINRYHDSTLHNLSNARKYRQIRLTLPELRYPKAVCRENVKLLFTQSNIYILLYPLHFENRRKNARLIFELKPVELKKKKKNGRKAPIKWLKLSRSLFITRFLYRSRFPDRSCPFFSPFRFNFIRKFDEKFGSFANETPVNISREHFAELWKPQKS